MAARERLDLLDDQTTRRDIVRASAAAMEGMMWLTREHIRNVLETLGELTPIVDLALQEQTYVVSNSGQLTVQSRSVPLQTAIRFMISQASIIEPGITVEYTDRGWHDLKQAVRVRNRITHPKPESDMSVSDDDLDRVASGLSWLMATTDYLMDSTNVALIRHTLILKDVVARLKSGDPEALADYHAALAKASDEDG